MKITVIGFGSWGIPLACILDKNGHEVTGWDGSAEYVKELCETRRNNCLPNVVIPKSIKITGDVKTAGENAEIFLSTLPSKVVGETAGVFASYFNAGKIIISGSKGLIANATLHKGACARQYGDSIICDAIEEEEGDVAKPRQMRICEYLQELAPECSIAVLTGPSHAEEVLKSIPTAVVVASEDEKTAETVQTIFSSDNFRVYTSADVIGAEMGGALKNVIAVAAGCSDGLGFGDNTKAALITRGIAEITRLGVAMGANENTFSGLSGIGDLIVTCTSTHSRNWRAGFLLAKGKTLSEALDEVGRSVEGVVTAKAALQLARKHGITMPIIEEINKILYERKPPKDAVSALMQRELKDERY